MKQGAENVPGNRLMQLLEQRKIACEARLGTWCFFDDTPGRTNWSEWAADSDEEANSNEEGERRNMRCNTVLARV